MKEVTKRMERNQKSQKSHVLKVILLGNGGVGKSCLMTRFVNDTFDNESYHTLGVEFLNKFIEINGTKYCLQIWDTAGQERFKSLRVPFFRGSDICILTYSITDRNSFNDLLSWKCEFLHYADIPDSKNFPFVVIGNKCDMADSRQVTKEEAETWCNESGFSFIETSAKDAINVEAAFHMALDKWVYSETKLSRPCSAPSVVLDDTPRQKLCC